MRGNNVGILRYGQAVISNYAQQRDDYGNHRRENGPINEEMRKFIYKIFKTIRKYGGSSVAITQDISDLFSLEDGAYGKSILNNSSIKTFFSLEEENINLLSKYSNLSEKEKIEIKSLRRGECLLFVGNEHILLKVEANNFEKNVIEK